MISKIAKAAARFLALQKNTTALLVMVVLVGTGERIAERFLPLYLLALGGGIMSVGIFSGANNLTNALYSFFGGYISDRFGQKRALHVFNIMTIGGYLIVIFFPYWQAVILGSFFFLSWTAISAPATLELVTRTVPAHKRTMGVSLNSLMRRVPMIIGPLCGGVLIERFGETQGIRYAFMIATVLALVSIAVQELLIDEMKQHQSRANANLPGLWNEMSDDLRQLLFSDVLIRFCEQIPYAFVVVWCINMVGVSPVNFSELTTVEMVTAILVYLPVAYYADKMSKKPFITTTFFFFTAFPLVLMFSRSFPALVLAFMLRGLKEFGEPTRKALIMELCPKDNKAGMFGFYYLLRDSVVAIAAFAGAWLWDVSPSVNLLTSFAFGVIGTVWFAFKGRDVISEPR